MDKAVIHRTHGPSNGRKMNGLLETKNAQLDAVLNTVPDAILSINSSGKIRSVNLAATVLFGYAREELLNTPINRLIPDLTLSSYGYNARPGKDEQIQGLAYETFARLRNGTEFNAEVTIGDIKSTSTKHEGKVIVVRDITERKILEATLSQQMRVLEQSNDNLGSFAQTVSHDLKEPLRKILHYAEQLISKKGVDARALEAGQGIYSTAKRMNTLIKDLLSFIALDQKVGVSKVNLTDVVNHVVHDLDILIKEKKAKIYYGELPTIEGNSTQLRQLFQNIISNALKFSKKNCRAVINIASKILKDNNDSSVCVLTIADNGIGFRSKYSSKIFSPFLRLNARHKYEGSGLGLAICKKIIAAHSGAIKASSALGVGSEITIVLPLKQQNADVIRHVA